MKTWLIGLWILYAEAAIGQTAVSYSSPGEVSAEKLARELTFGSVTELEKVKSIFHWITTNIDYQVRQFNGYPKFSREVEIEEEDDSKELKALDERVALQVLKKRTAVCDGYSRLFKTLCLYAGIEAELVTGYARTSADRIDGRFRSNHTWNAVRIDKEWKLLDVTWASGFVSWRGDYFIRHLNEEYFLADPDVFMKDHYPDDIRWTLLPNPPALQEFQFSPYRQRSFAKYHIRRFTPSKGIIHAKTGETIRIEITSSNPRKDANVYSDPFIDTSLYSNDNSALLMPENYSQEKIVYNYTVTDPRVSWLYILYHNDVILRYRLVTSGD